MLTKYGIEAFGFKEFPITDVIEVHFGILKVYSLRGISFKRECKTKQTDAVSIADRCNVIIAQSINEASKILTGDVFVDDENEWLSEKKVSPPFLLIYFKESKPRKLRGGHRQEKDGNIYTYEAFPKGKKEIKKWENDALPSIVTSLTVSFSTLKRQVKLIPIKSSVFGFTNEGQTLFDLKITASANAYISSPKSIEEMNSLLKNSEKLSSNLTSDICRNFYEALNESDKMKKFLGFFQFIERYTHRTYKSLNYKKDIQNAFTFPDRVKGSAVNFFENIFTDSKNLSQRFHWCSIFAWENIEGKDVSNFLDLKKIRDKISHGENIKEKDLPLDKAKILALKLLGTKET